MLGRIRETLSQPPRGYATWYGRVTRWWREQPGRIRALKLTCDVLKALCYVAYPLLLVLLWLSADGLSGDLLKSIFVPASGFALVTVLRVVLDEPRPYEACPIEQLISKDTRRKSFPSRHVFSIFAIAMCWLHFCPVVGIAMLATGCVMGAARVLGGVHYPRDVVAGALLGILWEMLLWL